MTNPPRVHHFVPQFWIRKFISVTGGLWSYDWKDDALKERSTRQLMQVINLYTIQPSGADDTSLEALDNQKIDNDGSRAFERVLNGDYSQAAKEDLAEFLAAQLLRDPAVVSTYNPRAQEVTLKLLEVFDAPDYSTFLTLWGRLYPGASATKAEYEHIKSLGLEGAENAVERIILALDSTEGLPELPFTDVVRDKNARNGVRDSLLACHWTLALSKPHEIILGDAGVLYEKGKLPPCKVPLCHDAALLLYSSANVSTGISTRSFVAHEVTALNLESASRARRWIVGDRPLLEKLKTQVQKNSFLSQ